MMMMKIAMTITMTEDNCNGGQSMIILPVVGQYNIMHNYLLYFEVVVVAFSYYLVPSPNDHTRSVNDNISFC